MPISRDPYTHPSPEEAPTPDPLAFFTDREDELAAFERLLQVPDGQPLPALNFHGVGGVRKTSLLDKLVAELRPDPQQPRAPAKCFA